MAVDRHDDQLWPGRAVWAGALMAKLTRKRARELARLTAADFVEWAQARRERLDRLEAETLAYDCATDGEGNDWPGV